ncbi:MAG: response regulator [Chroococcidiopsidaceae cyanobacterium CP_BM_ER_R8_30]|nr:response regulator [Chroococcidiopsidaceae cyanobacterium CP_BM_ER_R8_30]
MTTAKILVVEDETIVAKDLQRRLTRIGYVVPTTASSGEEALSKAKEVSPDLVLMDIRLKGKMDGVETAKQLQSCFNIPVIYLTAYTDKEISERAKVTQPLLYLLKPFKEKELCAAIATALDLDGGQTKKSA